MKPERPTGRFGGPPPPDALGLIVPAYRAASTLGRVLERARRAAPRALVLVVDDGSDDDTALAATAAGATVLSHPTNRGKGRALATGLGAAVARWCDPIVTLDADGQHPPEAIPDLVAPLYDLKADVVVGARRRDPRTMPPGRRLTNWLSSALLSRAVGYRVPDSQCGFRAMRRAVADRVRPTAARYDFETDFLFLAAEHGFRIGAVEIPTVYGDSPSHFRHLADTLALSAIFLRRWRRILWGPSAA